MNKVGFLISKYEKILTAIQDYSKSFLMTKFSLGIQHYRGWAFLSVLKDAIKGFFTWRTILIASSWSKGHFAWPTIAKEWETHSKHKTGHSLDSYLSDLGMYLVENWHFFILTLGSLYSLCLFKYSIYCGFSLGLCNIHVVPKTTLRFNKLTRIE